MVAVVADNVEKNFFFRPDNLLRLVTRLQGNSVNLKETASVTFNSVASYDGMGAAPSNNDKSNSATEQRVALKVEEEENTLLPTNDDADPQDAPRKRPVSRPGSNGASSAGSKSDAKSSMKTVDKKMEKTA